MDLLLLDANKIYQGVNNIRDKVGRILLAYGKIHNYIQINCTNVNKQAIKVGVLQIKIKTSVKVLERCCVFQY